MSRIANREGTSPAARLWLAVRTHWLVLLLAGVVFLISYVSTVRTEILFAPDTRYYAGMALNYGGVSQEDAAEQVMAESAKQGWASPDADLLFGWGLVQPRVVYPALSTPFVKVFGIDGLAVVPGLAMALLVGVAVLMIARRWGALPALASILLLCSSQRMMFYGAAMLTESLTALWGALILAAAWWYQRSPGKAGIAAMVGLTLLMAFTRQATLIPAGAFIMAWFVALVLRRKPNGWGVPALAVGVTAVATQVLQTKLFPTFSQSDQFMSKTGADTLTEAILKSPELAWDILKVDANYMAVSDRPLLVLLALALLSMVVFWRRTESHLLLGALLAYELYNVTNGTPTAFRYGMPGLIFVLVAVAMLVAEATNPGRAEAKR